VRGQETRERGDVRHTFEILFNIVFMWKALYHEVVDEYTVNWAYNHVNIVIKTETIKYAGAQTSCDMFSESLLSFNNEFHFNPHHYFLNTPTILHSLCNKLTMSLLVLLF